jgi:hypothetical protein
VTNQLSESRTAVQPVPDLTRYLADAVEWGADPGPLRGLLVYKVVAEGIAGHARSHQREIGPSQIGVPCDRWMAHKFAGTPTTGLAAPKWAAAVGTAVHGDFADWCHIYNERYGTRFLTDLRVMVGELLPGRPVFGTLDVLDVRTGTVIDLKVPGPSQMKRYAGQAPENPVYDTQVDLYGNGAINAGFPVAHCGILRLPRAGELSSANWKVRRHNPARAAEGLARAGRIATLVDAMGPAAIPLMRTTEHYCGGCDYFDPTASDLTRGCPGAVGTNGGTTTKALPTANDLLT